MSERRDSSYWWGFGDAGGADRAYEGARKEADKEFQETFAGPKAIDEMYVAPNDIRMKNPEGEFKDPAPMVESKAERTKPGWDSRGDRFHDPEGQQGGTEGGRPAFPPLPNEIHPVRNDE